MALMLSFPNCKINLGLYITRRRNDGYHDIETIFYPVDLKDALEIIPVKDKPEIHVSGKTIIGNNKSNLVWKAYELMRENFPEKIPAFDIYLHKTIPMGAGLGGGSANGAFMLRLINDFCKLELTEEELIKMAIHLGSDCPFFIYNTPQFAGGRGEKMEPVLIDLSKYSVQLICPKIHISTAHAFQIIKPQPATYDLRKLQKLPVKDWKDNISNAFEAHTFQQYPDLKNIKDQLYNHGALYASMSGSGAAIYGIFLKGEKAVINSSLKMESFLL